MDAMNLCVDVGNTRTKAAIYEGNELIAYEENADAALLTIWFEAFSIKKAMAVVSGKNKDVEDFLLSKKEFQPLTHLTPLPLVLDYDTPHTLGRDRIAAAVGADRLFPDIPKLVVDSGTCITIDFVKDGKFLGGVISPGVEMRLKAMNYFTKKLPLPKINRNLIFPGKSTEACLQLGSFQSAVMEVMGYFDQLLFDFPEIVLIHTGGMVLDFGITHKNKIFARPKLVVEGINQIIEHNIA